MRRSQAEADKASEGAIEEFFKGGGFAEDGEGGIHGLIIAVQLQLLRETSRYVALPASAKVLSFARDDGLKGEHVRRLHSLHKAE